ncbi:hypothetical protein AAW12_15045 [Sphingobacterium sp. Ag1]|nr:hypothetical protein AAW12_15045 [Sphingobacterium sp. Ag1]
MIKNKYSIQRSPPQLGCVFYISLKTILSTIFTKGTSYTLFKHDTESSLARLLIKYIESINYYMVKKEKMKKLLEINPLSFYMTNWGFVNNTSPKRARKTDQPSPKN